MKTIAVVTTTRAEYGLLAPIIKNLRSFEDDSFYVELIVSGTHLYDEYGCTIREIINDGVRIDEKILIPVSSRNAFDISRNQATTLSVFTELFLKKTYNAILILGDRYEMLAIAIAAANSKIPIFHISGGDTTEGAMDEWIRHCITKMSHIHFTTNAESYHRVIQMGEAPDRVYNYGSTSIDNIINIATMTKEESLKSIGMDVCKFAVCTYHPVTLEYGDITSRINEFLKAVKEFSNIQFVVTKSNADQGGAEINRLLDKANEEMNNIHVYTSLGVKRYLSLMKHSEFVLGNSSSGIVETPAFGIPTVNIGNRQRGRLQSESIINCGESSLEIITAIHKAMDADYRRMCKGIVSPYGDGHAAEKIANKILEIITGGKLDLKKKFYNMV